MVCRILYLVGQLGPGGLERQLVYLLQAMDRGRFQPAVVLWNDMPDDSHARDAIRLLGVPLYVLGGVSRYNKLEALRRLVRSLEPVILHSYSFFTNFTAWLCTRRTTTIPVGSIRNNFLSDRQQTGRVLGRVCARWPADQICNSLCAKRAVEGSPGLFKPSRLSVVTNRMDIGRFPGHAPMPLMPVLLAVGRLYREKRWDRLISAAGKVASLGLAFLIRIVGEGPERQALQSQAARLGVDQRIQFLGFRSDVPALLTRSTMLIHTSDDEGCPNVVMEAMACGRAVLATDAGDVPILVEDGKTGFVVRRGDDETFAKCLATLIVNRKLCADMGQAGRVKAEREFRLEWLVRETFAAYRAAGWREV